MPPEHREQAVQELKPKNKEELRNFLVAHHIPLDQWGKRDAKTVTSLFEEILDTDCKLIKINGEIIRESNVVEMHITYHNKTTGEMFKLHEDFEKLWDGRVRKRNLPWSVSGKMKQGESVKEAIARELLVEELPVLIGQNDNTEQEQEIKVRFRKIKVEPKKIVKQQSNSYPGLSNHTFVHVVNMELTKKQYNPEGYYSMISSKTTRFAKFSWKKI